MSELVLRGGLLFGPRGEEIADVRIADGRVAEIGDGLVSGPGSRDLDCTGCWVGPGFVDLHTHLREPGQEYKETVATGSVAAAAGGFTAVVAMPNTIPPIDDVETVRFVLARGEETGLVDVHVAATLTADRLGRRPAPLEDLYRAGVRVFTDDGDTVADRDLLRAVMERIAALGGVVSEHAVDPDLAAGGHMREGRVARKMGVAGLPAEAEAVIVSRDLELVRETGCRYHVQHLSTAAGVDLVASAKEEGLPVTAEVTPHHLAFEVGSLAGGDANFKMMPPLGSERDRDALRRGLRSGVIDAVATDHAPHAAREKEGDFEAAAFGVLGLAEAGAVVHDFAGLEPRAMFTRMAVAPARIARIDGHGQWPAVGLPANLVAFDPAARWTSVDTFSRSRNSPYLGMSFEGRARYTMCRGRVTRDATAEEDAR